MRQVQIAAGSLVLLGLVLAVLVSPWFMALSAFVGAGLIVAGLSGFCGMVEIALRLAEPGRRRTGAGLEAVERAEPRAQERTTSGVPGDQSGRGPIAGRGLVAALEALAGARPSAAPRRLARDGSSCILEPVA